MSAFELDPDDLPAELDAAERAELRETAAVLLAAEGGTRQGPRGDLRRALFDNGALLRRPLRLRRRAAAFLVAGATLILIAASGLTGSGPLAPPVDGSGQVAQLR